MNATRRYVTTISRRTDDGTDDRANGHRTDDDGTDGRRIKTAPTGRRTNDDKGTDDGTDRLREDDDGDGTGTPRRTDDAYSAKVSNTALGPIF